MARARPLIRPLEGAEAERCEAILRALPDWFGIEEAIVEYRRDIETLETYAALDGAELVGFITLKSHNRYAAEIQVLAVVAEHHGKGYGRALVAHAEALLRARAVEYLQVKTLGPSRPSDHYARTRSFYHALGFRPLEENSLWGETNPCLILVKHLC